MISCANTITCWWYVMAGKPNSHCGSQGQLDCHWLSLKMSITETQDEDSIGPHFNSLAPKKFEQNFRYVIFMLISVTDGWGISCKIVLRWMPLDLTDKLTLVQVMAWCCQTAQSHYLSQCWPIFMSPYGVTRPQLVTWSVVTWFQV